MAKELPVLIDWKGLRTLLGHPWQRAHTYRLSDPAYCDPPFPQPVKPMAFQSAKLGRNVRALRSKRVWRTREVLAWYRAHGIHVDE
jgi:hypothetical protein